jgi:hypothetical protein
MEVELDVKSIATEKNTKIINKNDLKYKARRLLSSDSGEVLKTSAAIVFFFSLAQ